MIIENDWEDDSLSLKIRAEKLHRAYSARIESC